MRHSGDHDPLRAAAHEIEWQAGRLTNDSASDIVDLIAGAPYAAGTPEHRRFERIGAIADGVMGRTRLTTETVDSFYTRARVGHPGEQAFVGGRDALALHDYPADTVATLPCSVTASFLGLGNPWPAVLGEHRTTASAIVDVGCGSGLDLAVARSIWPDADLIVGIDKRPDLFAIATRSCPQAHLLVGEATSLPVASGRFDVVVANGLPPFQRPQSIVDTAAEAMRLLTPDGVLLATILTADPALAGVLREDGQRSPEFALGLSLLITGKPTIEHVRRSFAGAVVTQTRGRNPYRDPVVRTRTAMYAVAVRAR